MHGRNVFYIFEHPNTRTPTPHKHLSQKSEPEISERKLHLARRAIALKEVLPIAPGGPNHKNHTQQIQISSISTIFDILLWILLNIRNNSKHLFFLLHPTLFAYRYHVSYFIPASLGTRATFPKLKLLIYLHLSWYISIPQ